MSTERGTYPVFEYQAVRDDGAGGSVILQLDTTGYHRLTPDQRDEVNTWLTANGLQGDLVRRYEVTGEGEVLITVLERDENGHIYATLDGNVAERQFAITPTTPPPHYNPA